MNRPFFSIVTVSLNHLEGLRRTYESLQTQGECDFEWIVIDGGSTDGTGAFLADARPDSLCSEPDRGIYDAMNKGIERSCGVYVLFLNAGDALAGPGVLSAVRKAAEGRGNPALIYGDSLEGGHYKTARSHTKIVQGLFTHHQAIFYRRDAMEISVPLKDRRYFPQRHSPAWPGNPWIARIKRAMTTKERNDHKIRYDLPYKIAADYEMTARFLRRCSGDALYVPLPVCVFEGGGLSQVRAVEGRREQFRIRSALGLCPLWYNALVYGAQSVRWAVRKTAPGLYWRLKSCGSSAPGCGRNPALRARPESRP